MRDVEAGELLADEIDPDRGWRLDGEIALVPVRRAAQEGRVLELEFKDDLILLVGDDQGAGVPAAGAGSLVDGVRVI